MHVVPCCASGAADAERGSGFVEAEEVVSERAVVGYECCEPGCVDEAFC